MPDNSAPKRLSTYRHPPVAEAVIEIRFAQAVAADRLEHAAQRIRQNYKFIDTEQQVDMQFDAVTNKSDINTRVVGFRLASENRDNTAIVRENCLIVARLAPYTGWEELFSRAQADWVIWKKAIGPLKLARIGIRYVNRIDIPEDHEGSIRIEDYLTVYPYVPEGTFKTISNYAMQISAGLSYENYGILINSGSVPSPLVGHISFALDLDLFRDISLPQRDEEMWEMIRAMRDIKNSTFESCITDRAREMFES